MLISIRLTNDDERIMKAIEAFIIQHGRTPKKREVVTGSCLPKDFKATRANRVFERLKLLGIIDHSLNGYCHLTAQGKQAIRLRYPASTIMEELTTRIRRLDEATDERDLAQLRERAHGFVHGLLLASALTDELHEEVLEAINTAADRGLNHLAPDFFKNRQHIPSKWKELEHRLQLIANLLLELHPERA